MPLAQVNDQEIFYRLEGSGEPVLLIMGLAVTHAGWDLQREALSDSYQVCVFDNRGVGQSSVPRPPYRIDDLAADALGLLDVLGWSRAHVVGISMGGMIAQRLALKAPERVRSLALLATHAGGWSARPTRTAVTGVLKTHMVGGQARRERNLLRMLHSEPYLEAVGEGVALEALRRKLIDARPSRQGVAGQVAAVLRHRSHPELSALRGRFPALVVVGTADRMVRPENSERIAAALDAELMVFEGYGHAIHVERVEAVNAALRRLFGAATP